MQPFVLFIQNVRLSLVYYILAPLAPAAAFIGINAEAAPLIGLVAGGITGGKVVGPGVHYLAHREQYRKIEELKAKK